MKLIRLKISNFKGMRHFELETRGHNVSILGDNGAGKTTLVDAWCWLLFDKDSANRKDFELKTLGPDGQPLHGVDHAVEAVLNLADGQTVELRKVYREQWTKRRGEAQKTFTGHTTEHFVDGVPVTKGEYQATVAQIADESVFRLLTDPAYFNEHLHWQDRRRLLIEVCGDVPDADVIASDKVLAELPAILGRRSLDDHRKVIASRRSEINRELDRIPVRIDEVVKGLPAIEGTKEEIVSQLVALRSERAKAEEARVQLQSGGAVADKQARLRTIDAEIREIETNLRLAAEQATRDSLRALSVAQAALDSKEREIQREQRDLDHGRGEHASLETRMADLRKRWHAVDQEEFTFTQNDTCPACGQNLPLERLQAAREKALADFNASKSRRLEEIQADGKRLRARADEIALDIQRNEARLAEFLAETATLRTQIAALQADIEGQRSRVPDATPQPSYQQLQSEKVRVEAEIASLRQGSREELDRIAAQVDALDRQIAAAEEQLSRFAQREQGLARIDDLKAEERNLAAEFERLERELYLTDQFVRCKVRMLEERINSRFKLARFKLFNTLVNGGVEECCETTYQGVPYGSLNHGSQLNVGLDIINTLAEHYGFTPPVWVDNAESVTSILPTRGQQIQLVVSAQDKTLRVAVPSTRIKEAV